MMGGDLDGAPIRWSEWCYESWKLQYGIKPPWGGPEFAQLATARKRFESEELARAAWRAFLESGDPFYAGKEPKMFLSSLSRWIVKVPAKRKKPEQVEGEAIVARQRIMREVYQDASIPEAEKRNEYARRARELSNE
jgi:hypothetical protein